MWCQSTNMTARHPKQNITKVNMHISKQIHKALRLPWNLLFAVHKVLYVPENLFIKCSNHHKICASRFTLCSPAGAFRIKNTSTGEFVQIWKWATSAKLTIHCACHKIDAHWQRPPPSPKRCGCHDLHIEVKRFWPSAPATTSRLDTTKTRWFPCASFGGMDIHSRRL